MDAETGQRLALEINRRRMLLRDADGAENLGCSKDSMFSAVIGRCLYFPKFLLDNL
jgi:hypothetical protein